MLCGVCGAPCDRAVWCDAVCMCVCVCPSNPARQDEEARAIQPAVRSIKTRARELQQREGLSAAKAAKLAAQQVTGAWRAGASGAGCGVLPSLWFLRARASEDSARARWLEVGCVWHGVRGATPRRPPTPCRAVPPHMTCRTAPSAGLKSGSKKKKVSAGKRQKTEGGEGGGGGGEAGLFSGDGLNTARPGKLSLSGSSSDAFKTVGRFGGKLRSQLSKTEMNTLKRGGKGKAAFKSKGRFKRKR